MIVGVIQVVKLIRFIVVWCPPFYVPLAKWVFLLIGRLFCFLLLLIPCLPKGPRRQILEAAMRPVFIVPAPMRFQTYLRVIHRSEDFAR